MSASATSRMRMAGTRSGQAGRRVARLLGAAGAVLTLLLGVTETAQAQRSFVGISGGATYSDLAGGGVNTDSRWGGTAGVTAGYRNWDYLVSQLEVNWVQKGGADVRLDYIEIPLLFGGVVQGNDGTGARIYTGIGVGFPVGCSADTDLACDADHRTEWTWPVGLQLGRWADRGRFFALDVRYSWAFTDTFEGAYAQNRSWQFRLVVGTPR